MKSMSGMQIVKYGGYNDGRGPSAGLWGDLPPDLGADPNCGFVVGDDFLNFSQHISAQDVQEYSSYIDTGVTMTQQATITTLLNEAGVMVMGGNDADNDEGVLATHGPITQVSDTAGDAKKMWFEAKWKKASVADNALAVFIGLAFDNGSAVPVTNTLCLTDDDGALGAFSFLGFHVDQANGDSMDFVFKAEGQTAVVVKSGVHVPVADTYVKLGFKYDPSAPPAKRIAIYIDGVEQTTYVTATQIAAATFPDAEPLGFTYCGKVGAAAEVLSQVDWWFCGQAF
jgi:hypothetical protein